MPPACSPPSTRVCCAATRVWGGPSGIAAIGPRAMSSRAVSRSSRRTVPAAPRAMPAARKGRKRAMLTRSRPATRTRSRRCAPRCRPRCPRIRRPRPAIFRPRRVNAGPPRARISTRPRSAPPCTPAPYRRRLRFAALEATHGGSRVETAARAVGQSALGLMQELLGRPVSPQALIEDIRRLNPTG